LKDQGKIRFKAFSTHIHWPEILKAAADEGFYDVVLLSFNYSMNNDKTAFETMKYAVSKGIGLIAMKTQCQQDWYKSNLSAEMQKFYEGNIMHGALLKWVMQHEFITTSIPGFTTFEQLKTDMEVAYNIEYTPDEKKFLEDHHVVEAIQSVCRFCGGCNDTCPYGVDIPALMRTQMYAASYGNFHMARSTFSAIPGENGLKVCEGCDECVAKCRNNVQIAERLEELKILMA
jgi:predicted aldo/keto reductase-like oxidoreductase